MFIEGSTVLDLILEFTRDIPHIMVVDVYVFFLSHRGQSRGRLISQ